MRLSNTATTIAIFHSVLGLRSVEQDAAERFRTAGFEVALPDLYAGNRTESLDEGFQLMGEIGWPVICRRAFEAIKKLPDSTILAGVQPPDEFECKNAAR